MAKSVQGLMFPNGTKVEGSTVGFSRQELGTGGTGINTWKHYGYAREGYWVQYDTVDPDFIGSTYDAVAGEKVGYYTKESTGFGQTATTYFLFHELGNLQSVNINYYDVTTSPGTGGTMSGAGQYKEGSDVTVTASPKTGFVIGSIATTDYNIASQKNDLTTGSLGYTITNISSDYPVSATFFRYWKVGYYRYPRDRIPSSGDTTKSFGRSYDVDTTLKKWSDLGWSLPSGTYFDGWLYENNRYLPGDKIENPDKPTSNTLKSKYFRAIWSDKQHELTVVYGNGQATGVIVPSSSDTAFGDITLPSAPTKAGYTFAGWEIGGVTYAAGATYSLTADATATAQWTAGAYTLTVEVNAGIQSIALEYYQNGSKQTRTFTEGDSVQADFGARYFATVTAKAGYGFAAATGAFPAYMTTKTVSGKMNSTSGATFSPTATGLPFELMYDNLFSLWGWLKSKSHAAQNSGYTVRTTDDWPLITTGTDTYAHTAYGESDEYYNIPVNENDEGAEYLVSCRFGSDTSGGAPKHAAVFVVQLTLNHTIIQEELANGKKQNYQRVVYQNSGDANTYYSGSFTIKPGCRNLQLFFEANITDTNVAAKFTDIRLVKKSDWQGPGLMNGTRKTQTRDHLGYWDAEKTTFAEYKSNSPPNYRDLNKYPNGFAGYTFDGWYKESTRTTQVYAGSSTTGFAPSVPQYGTTLYSKWTASKYTVKKLSNYTGGPTWGDTAATFDTPFSATAPSRTGYKFMGWKVTAGLDTTTAKYGASQTSVNSAISNSNTLCKNGEPSGTVWFLNLTATNNATATITAQWTAQTYTVTLDRQNGTGGTASVTATYDAAMPTATMPKRDGYIFEGYYDATTGGTQYYTATGASARVWNKTAATPVLYARWRAQTYTVKFNPGGMGTISGYGKGESSEKTVAFDSTYNYNAGTNANDGLPTPTRTGYAFGGWWTGTNGSGTQITASTKVAITANQTLYAKWTANTYNILFDNLFNYNKYHTSASFGVPDTTNTVLETGQNSTVVSGQTVNAFGWMRLINNITVGWARTKYSVDGGTGTYYKMAVAAETKYRFSCRIVQLGTGAYFTKWTDPGAWYVAYDKDGKIILNNDGHYRFIALGKQESAGATNGRVEGDFTTPKGCTSIQIVLAVNRSKDDTSKKSAVFQDISLYRYYPYAQTTLHAYGGRRKNQTYSDESGATIGGQITATNSNVTWPADPTRTGYTFDGWYDTDSGGTTGGTGTEVFATSKPRSDNDLHLWSKWTVNEYKLTLELGDHVKKIYYKINGAQDWTLVEKTASTTSVVLNVNYGSTWYAYAEADVGYTAYYPSASNNYSKTKAASPETVTFTTYANTYTVTYDANKGEFSGNVKTKTVKVTFGQKYNLPSESPMIEGASFLKWNMRSDGEGDTVTNATTVSTAGDHSVYAIWSGGWTANIGYDLDSGTWGSEEGPKTSVYTATTEIPAPTKTHHRFTGWLVSGDLGSGALWGTDPNTLNEEIKATLRLVGASPGDPVYVTKLALKDNADVTFTATWEQVKYSVTIKNEYDAHFDVTALGANGKTITFKSAGETITVDAGTTLTLTATMTYAKRTDWTFSCPFDISGSVESSKKFVRTAGEAGAKAVFTWSHTFRDDETASQTWTVRRQLVKVEIGANSFPAEWKQNLYPTMEFADDAQSTTNTTTDIRITPASNKVIEPKTPQKTWVRPEKYYIENSGNESSGNVIYVKTRDTSEDDRDVDPVADGIGVTLEYDLTKIDVKVAFHGTCANYAAAHNGWAVAVKKKTADSTNTWDASNDKATKQQIDYDGSAEVHIFKPSTTKAEFAGWYAEDGTLLSEADSYVLNKVVKDRMVYAKLRAPVTINSKKLETNVEDEQTHVYVKAPGAAQYSEVFTFPYSVMALFGETVSIKAATTESTTGEAHFAGWFYYSGSSDNPLGAATGFGDIENIKVDSDIYDLVPRFTNKANVFYVALYARTKAGSGGAFIDNGSVIFDVQTEDKVITGISRSAYKTATRYRKLEDENDDGTGGVTDGVDTTMFYEVQDIRRFVVGKVTDESGTLITQGTFSIKKLPNGEEIQISNEPSFTSVINANYAFFFDKADASRSKITVIAQGDTSVDNTKVMGSVRVGSGATPITVEETIDGRITKESGKFILGRTATIYAFAENGYKFAGWYNNSGFTGDPVSMDAIYSFEMTAGDKDFYAKFQKAEYALYEWEGSDENKQMTWRSKVYELSKPANLTSVRVDTQKYPLARFKSESYSSPDATPTQTVDFKYTDNLNDTRIKSQTMRRLPQRRPERFFAVEVQNDAEIDSITIGTSGGGLAT